MARYWTAHNRTKDPSDLFVPITETLWWARAVDENLQNRDGYSRSRATDDSGRVMVAIRFARNRAGHTLAPLLRHDGVSLPLSLPMRMGGGWLWAPIDELPLSPERPDRAGRRAYAECLAGQPVVGTLQSVAQWVQRWHPGVQVLPEPDGDRCH